MWTKMAVAAVIVATGFQTAFLVTYVVAQEPKPAISAELAAELKALASRDYKSREKACQQLTARKLEAIEPLSRLASEGTSEESIRAFEVLRRIYREGNKDVHEAIESAMESLIKSDNSNVIARAESAVEEAAPIRHVRAIASFQELGGIIRYDEEFAKPADGETRPIKYAMINHNWKGGDEGLKHLKRIEDFRFQTEIRGPVLYVTPKCPVGKEALAEMQSHLPMLAILKRGPACLGVSPSLGFGGPPNALFIHRVEMGSAADLAGLKPGDCIVKFNGYDVPDFETLVDKIGEKLPGDKVPVEFIRGDTEHTVTVELRSW